jgi:hypothetical protein
MRLVLRNVCNKVSILQEVQLSGYVQKCPWKKLQNSLVIHLCCKKEWSNGTNSYIKFFLNHELLEPETYIARKRSIPTERSPLAGEVSAKFAEKGVSRSERGDPLRP